MASTVFVYIRDVRFYKNIDVNIDLKESMYDVYYKSNKIRKLKEPTAKNGKREKNVICCIFGVNSARITCYIFGDNIDVFDDNVSMLLKPKH